MKTVFELFKELDVNSFFIVLFMLIAMICPGILIIYLYNNQLFITLNIIKLILLSISISSPVFLFNFIINYFIAHRLLNKLSFVDVRVEWQNGGQEFMSELSEASIGGSIRNSFFSLYGGILISYIFDLSTFDLIYSIIVLEIFAIIFTYIIEKNTANDLEEHNKNNSSV
jgi:hypothetical protein